MSEDNLSVVQQLIRDISMLSKALPTTIPEGLPTDRMYHVIQNVESDEGEWPTFNRKFDLLFGIDCFDANGALKHVSRGEYGMDAVATYLQSLSLRNLPLELVQIKLQRIRDWLLRARLATCMY